MAPQRRAGSGGEARSGAVAEADATATAAPAENSRRGGSALRCYPNDLWTSRRIAAVIKRELKIDYHPAHVTRILAQLDWSCQKPERRAVERNEAAIAHWKRYRWVEIKKKPGA